MQPCPQPRNRNILSNSLHQTLFSIPSLPKGLPELEEKYNNRTSIRVGKGSLVSWPAVGDLGLISSIFEGSMFPPLGLELVAKIHQLYGPES